MNEEAEILLKMKNLNEKYKFFLKELKHFLNETDTDIYFKLTRLYDEYDIFEEHDFFLNKVKNKSNIRDTIYINRVINEKLIKKCNHHFIEDDIDITPEQSMRITYCEYCNNNLDECTKK